MNWREEPNGSGLRSGLRRVRPDRVSREVFRVGRRQQAFFALFDAFVKVLLTCVHEPASELRPQAIARAKDRYDRLVKSAGQNMSGEALAAMKDLVNHGAE